MFFTLGLRRTFPLCQRGLSLVHSLVVQASFASFKAVSQKPSVRRTEMTSSTTDGTPSSCDVCGKNVWITPSDPPGDATCPHCGSLVWFDTPLSSDTIKQLADRGVHAEMNAEGDIVSLRFSGSSYDDSVITQLAKLHDLSSIDISDTSVTPAGAACLRELLPTTTVIH